MSLLLLVGLKLARQFMLTVDVNGVHFGIT